MTPHHVFFYTFSHAFPPISSMPSSAKLATCIECWKVPGASADNLLNKGLFVSDNSKSEISETNEKIFSNKKIICRLDPNLVRPKDIDLQISNFKKFQKDTGWKPKTNLNKSILNLLNECRKKKNL